MMFASPDEILEAARRFTPTQYPEPEAAITEYRWIYAEGQYEAAVLDRLVREGHAATTFAEFANNYRRPADRLLARATMGEAAEVRVWADDEWQVFRSSMDSPYVEIDLESSAGSSPTFAVEPSSTIAWSVSTDGERWGRPHDRLGDATPPHLVGEPIVTMRPVSHGRGEYEFAAPMLGRPVIASDSKPRVSSGESLPEARFAGEPENRTNVIRRPDGRWTTEHEIAARYLILSGAAPTDIYFEARLRPLPGRGAFVCSDDRLNQIWAASAFTLRLCMQSLVVDGLKRDRMPWAGDQALNTVSNAFAVGDAQIVRDGLVALGHPDHGYVNGIADYSLWWLINSRILVSHLGDTSYAHDTAEHINAFTAELARYAGDDGVLVPDTQLDGFVGTGAGSVFIDWGVINAEGLTSTALQALWYWALRSSSELLTLAAHPGAERWTALAGTLEATLRQRAWNESTQVWTEHLDQPLGATSYANFLAILSGLHEESATREMLAVIRDGRAGTPFMRSSALRALGIAGDVDSAIQEIRERWGEMLDFGSVTFWEEFTKEGETPYEMYGRPFAKSFCHAWSSGPASLLPELTLGLTPVEDGWRTFRVHPNLGGLLWAAAVVPTRFGHIAATVEGELLEVWIPIGTRLQTSSGYFDGPAHFRGAVPR